MNDLDFADEPEPVREVHAIRQLIREETKNMTPLQRLNYYVKSGEDVAKKYGFKGRCRKITAGYPGRQSQSKQNGASKIF